MATKIIDGNHTSETFNNWEKYHEGWFDYVCRKGDEICAPAFVSEHEARVYWDEEYDEYLEEYIEEYIEDLMSTHTSIDDYMTDAPEKYSSIVYGDNTDLLPDSNDDEIERQAENLQYLYDSEDDPL